MSLAVREPLSAAWPAIPLVGGKLRPAVPRTGSVVRARLLDRLLDADRPQIVSVVAAPGYGKTTLLAQWAAADPRPVAWLSLDDLDNDPAVLVAYLATALAMVGPIGDDVVPRWPEEPGDLVVATALPRLLADVQRWREPAALVIDNAHLLVHREALDALTTLLDRLPPGFHAAIAGRSEPGLPLARYLAERRLLEIDEVGLAFDEVEALQLTSAMGLRLDRDQVRDLTLRTEGWATAIYLEACWRGRRDPAQAGCGGATGAGREIAVYLESEVGQALDSDDLWFLAATSVLGRVEPAVAEAVTGMPGAADRLARLARVNRLIVDMGPPDSAFRYHNLLRDYLGAELERRRPGEAIRIHRRASSCFAAAGEAELAVEHAIAGGDMRAAANLASASSIELLYHGRGAIFERWLAAFGNADLVRNGPLAVSAGFVHALNGRPDAAERMADLAERAVCVGRPPDGSASFATQRLQLRTLMARHGPAAMLEDASIAVADEPPGSRWHAAANVQLGSAHLLLGEMAAAEAAFDTACGSPASGAASTAIALTQLASIAIRRGDWSSAFRCSRQSRALLAETHFDSLVTGLPVYAISARVALQRGDVDAARRDLIKAQRVRPLASHATPWLSVGGLMELARAYLAVSDAAGAQVAVREAEQIIRRRPSLGILVVELCDLRQRIAGVATSLLGSSSLTTAELRILPFLPTYLSFGDIADRLGISRNTVKTHAMSIYGKLWVSSRGEAVERAVELGLLEPYPMLGQARHTD